MALDDATLSIAQQFEKQGVRVLSQQNKGASAARNTAYSHCRGDYIQWLDADDLLAPDKIERQMQLISQESLDSRVLLSSAWGSFVHRPWRSRFQPTALWSDLTPKEWLLRKMGLNIFMQTATWLVSRELSESAGEWDERLIGDDDGEYFARVLLNSKAIKFVPQAKVFYRVLRPGSRSCIEDSAEGIKAHWLSMQLQINYVRSLGDDKRARDVCRQFLRNSVMYFYPEKTEILREMRELGAEFGGTVCRPVLPWNHAAIAAILGDRESKIFRRFLRRIKWRAFRAFDYLLFLKERGGRAETGCSHV